MGASGSLSHSVSLTLAVSQSSDYSLASSATTINILAGSSGTSTLTVASIGGFSGTVSLSVSAGTGLTGSTSPTSLSRIPGGIATFNLTAASGGSRSTR